MSKRNERREADRIARKLAYQQSAQTTPAAAAAQSPAFEPMMPTGNFESMQRLIDSLEAKSAHFSPEELESLKGAEPEMHAAILEAKAAAANLRDELALQGHIPTPGEAHTRPATEAQINANRQNAQKSTGAATSEGKATVSQNRRTHGLAGHFHLLPWENAEDFRDLARSIYDEHKPESPTEQRLIDSMVQHYWLKQRAIGLQDELLLAAPHPTEVDGQKLSLFLRYQTTHERSYYKAEKELQNLKKTKQKEEIGFESQKQKTAALEAQVRLAHARATNLEIDSAARQVIEAQTAQRVPPHNTGIRAAMSGPFCTCPLEAPLSGNFHISLEDLTKACSTAIGLLVTKNSAKTNKEGTNLYSCSEKISTPLATNIPASCATKPKAASNTPSKRPAVATNRRICHPAPY
jgi:hypothetical protein